MTMTMQAQAGRRAAVIAEKDNIRRQAGEEIERLIALLDRLEGDPDLEPYLSGTPLTGGGDDRELDFDDEPLFGWTDHEITTGRYVHGVVPDGEGEHDGREPDDDLEDGADEEPDVDEEPSLGWTEQEARWSRYSDEGRADRELAAAASPAYRKRLRRRRKAGPAIANVDVRPHYSGVKLLPNDGSLITVFGRTVY